MIFSTAKIHKKYDIVCIFVCFSKKSEESHLFTFRCCHSPFHTIMVRNTRDSGLNKVKKWLNTNVVEPSIKIRIIQF